MKIRAICNDFFPSFSRWLLFFLFYERIDNGSSDPREKPTKTEAPKRRRGNEDRFTAHGTRRWTSGKKVGQTAQLPLGTCSAPLPERFSRISYSLRATWRARTSFLNRQTSIKLGGSNQQNFHAHMSFSRVINYSVDYQLSRIDYQSSVNDHQTK